MNKLSKSLSAILAASLIVLAASGPLQAGVTASSFVEIENFVIKGSDGSVLNANTDFSSLSLTRSADEDVVLGGVQQVLNDSNSTADINFPVICEGTCPQIGADGFPVISGAPVANFATADQIGVGSPFTSLGAHLGNGSYVGIDTGTTTGSANSNTSLEGSWIFEADQQDGISFEFNARAYMEAFASAGEQAPSKAQAGHSVVITLTNLVTGQVVLSLEPAVLNGSTAANPNNQSFDLQTCGPHTCGVESTVTITSGTLPLDNASIYQLSVRVNTNADAARVEPELANLGDRVWNDLDADGDQDCSTPNGAVIGDGDDGCAEPGIPNVIVNLLTPGNDGICDNGDEVQINSTTTDADGFYLFIGLTPGSYCVEFDKPSAGAELQCVAAAGVQSSPQDAIGVGDTVDSDASPSSGQTGNIDLDAGETDLTNDAGFYCPAQQPASLGDRVWNDENADGDQDCTTPSGNAIDSVIGDGDDGCAEPGIGGVIVTLYENCGTNDEVMVDSKSTDANGFYLFDNLLPGTYCVEFDKNSAGQALGCQAFIGGVESSPQDVGDDTLDSDADPTTGRTGDIGLLAGDNNLTNDAGFYCPAKIGDYLIDDRNRDGLQGDLIDEPGVGDQEVQLVECVGGVPGTDVIDSQITGPDGMYMFNPLPPGEYAVIFSKPPDTVFSPQNVPGDEAKDCDTNVNGVSDCVTLGPDEYNQDVDACINIPPVAGLGDFVWEDLNVDGQQDGEPGIPGVTVNLLRPGPDDICNEGDDDVAVPGGTTTTAANGFYEFTNLQPGRYCVEFDINSLPDDFCTTEQDGISYPLGTPQFTLHNVGVDTGDSDADTMTGKTGNIDLGDDEYDPTNDAGIYCPAKIGDLVWEDTDKDGLQDNSENGIPDVEVKLFDCGANGEIGGGDDTDTGESRFTDVDGMYMFGADSLLDLPPGSYYVQFIKPDGTEFTLPDVSSEDGDKVDSDCLTPDGVSECITVGSRGINLTRDCGIIPPPPPECDLIINKTCRVETPPPPTFDKCQGKLQEFTVIWTGGPITISGELSNHTNVVNVATNQEVTFTGPFSQNDVFVNIAGAVSGQSKFHMSCSDDDFNSPDDCGKAAGDGKDTNDGFINAWKLEGFIDDDGTVLDCTSGTTADFPVEENCEFTQQPANCDISGKPTSLTFLYSGAGCGDSNNAQDPSKAVCTGDVNGLLPVTVVAGKTDLSNPYTVAPVSVAPGEMFTMSADKFDSNSRIDISNAGGTESNLLHLSCSQPLAVGDKYGSLELVGFNDVGNGVEVLFGYEVTNNGDPVTGVRITDNILGDIAGPFDLNDNTPVRFTKIGTVTRTTTNVATASGVLDNEECKDTDEVTVEVVQPVTPVSCSDIKDITAVSVVWGGSGAVDITTESGEVFLDVQPGNKITFQEAGTGNDVELFLSGAINGTSKFHVSCSDDDMNGTEDCGSNQGNGKDDDSDFINTWLFDGMTGKDGSFDCELPNTGVVDPEAGGGPSTGNVTGDSTLDLSDDRVKWELTNNGTQDVFITRVMVTWPIGHEQVKKFKLDGDFAKDVFDGGGSTVVPDDKAFESDASKRRLKAGDKKNLEIEFTGKSKDHVQGDYTIKVDFDNGQVLMFP